MQHPDAAPLRLLGQPARHPVAVVDQLEADVRVGGVHPPGEFGRRRPASACPRTRRPAAAGPPVGRGNSTTRCGGSAARRPDHGPGRSVPRRLRRAGRAAGPPAAPAPAAGGRGSGPGCAPSARWAARVGHLAGPAAPNVAAGRAQCRSIRSPRCVVAAGTQRVMPSGASRSTCGRPVRAGRRPAAPPGRPGAAGASSGAASTAAGSCGRVPAEQSVDGASGRRPRRRTGCAGPGACAIAPSRSQPDCW